jgi:hypothetical protein
MLLILSLPGLRMYVIVFPADHFADPLTVFAWPQYVCVCVLCLLIILLILSLSLPGLSLYVIVFGAS